MKTYTGTLVQVPDLKRLEENSLQDFPFTSPFLRATFNRYKNNGDKQSAIKFELLAQTPESDILSLRS